MDEDRLLRQYVEHGSEEAFEQIVRRYIGIVYAAARRQVRDPGHAEDVTQAVFVALAKSARKLEGARVLSAWLLTTTRYAALNLKTMESRRRHHEQQAGAQAAAAANADAPVQDAQVQLWDEVAPMLDEAIGSLPTSRRDAVVLRYLEGKSVREVAQRLSISEDAAKQRLSRAVEQLRTFFGRRGVRLSAGALAALLPAGAVEAVPASLLASTVAAATATSTVAAASATAALGKGALIMAMTKKEVLAVALWLSVSGGTVAMGVWQFFERPAQTMMTVAPVGVRPGVTDRAPTDLGDVILTPLSAAPARVEGRTSEAIVLKPDRQPATKVWVYLSPMEKPLWFEGKGPIDAAGIACRQNGRFPYAPVDGIKSIVAQSPDGFGEISPAELEAKREIVLLPWGRVAGTLTVAGKPSAGETVGLFYHLWEDERRPGRHYVTLAEATKSNQRGQFEFSRVAPRGVWVAKLAPGVWGTKLADVTDGVFVRARSGTVARADFGSPGATIIGRMNAVGLSDDMALAGQVAARGPLAGTLFPDEQDALSRYEKTMWGPRWLEARQTRVLTADRGIRRWLVAGGGRPGRQVHVAAGGPPGHDGHRHQRHHVRGAFDGRRTA